MKKKSIFVIICCILSALLFISIFVLSALVSNPSTKIDGPRQISGVEKESGESDKYSYVFGSDTVNGEINWLLETDPEQPLASNNISWKKLDGATGAITWTGNLAVDTYNLVLRAAIKDQSLKNAKLDITLKISTPALTIVGPTEIDDSNLSYESSEYSLYIGEEDVTNDSKYTWLLLTLSNSSGNYESNVNINITANHKIVWNKSLNNNSYNLKLQIIEGKNTWDKDIVLTLTRPRIILNYDNVPISNNTIPPHIYDYNNPGEPTYSKEFKAFGINNVDISDQVLWQTNITSSLNDPDEEAKILFFNHQFQWDGSIKAGNYTITLKAGNMQYLDSSTITFRLEVPAAPIKISNDTSTQPTDLQGDFYNIGTTSGNGKYLAGVSTSVYWLYDENDDPLSDASEQIWEIRSDDNFQDTSGLYTLTNTDDIWYDPFDQKIHWNTNLPFNNVTFNLKLIAISYEESYYGWSDPINLTFKVDWEKIDTFIRLPDGSAQYPTTNGNVDFFNIDAPFFSDNNDELDNCVSTFSFDTNSINAIGTMINNEIDYELNAVKYCDKVDSDPNWNAEESKKYIDWDIANSGIWDIANSDIHHLPNYSTMIDFDGDSISWTYQLTPYYIYQLEIKYINHDSNLTCYAETTFFINLSFKYDYFKENNTIRPFFLNKQSQDWLTNVNNQTNPATWKYWDYPKSTGQLWSDSTLEKTINRAAITEVYMTYINPYRYYTSITGGSGQWSEASTTGNPSYVVFPPNFLTNFFMNCTQLKRVCIIITAATGSRNPFGNTNVFRSTFENCSSLTDVIIKYKNYVPNAFAQLASWDNSYTYNSTFRNCTSLTGVTMKIGFEPENSTTYWQAGLPTNYPNLDNCFTSMFANCTSLIIGNKTTPDDTKFVICLGGSVPSVLAPYTPEYSCANLYSGMFRNCPTFAQANNNQNYDPTNNSKQYGYIISPYNDPNNGGDVKIQSTTNITSTELQTAQQYPIVVKGANKTGFLLQIP